MPTRPRLAGAFAAGMILALAACGRNEVPPPAAPAVLVRPAVAAEAAGAAYSGEVRARHEVDLGFRVGGKIASRLVDAGASVRAGQALARLDPADLQLAQQAAAAQEAAAASEFATAGAERDRYRRLLTQGFVSQAAYDVRENAWRGAQARLAQARAQKALSGNQTTYGTLAADHDGVIAAVLADAGQVVGAGQPVFRLARPEEKEVAVAVPEGRIRDLRAARQIGISLWARPDLALRGELRELAATADPATRTYAARIRIVDAPPGVELGMTARVLLAAEAAAGVVVPLTAVVDHGKGPQVWVVVDGKAEPRAVTVARHREDGVVVAGGLQAGEPVIVAGQLRLVAGQPVTARAATEPARQR
jgi:RND family efflux transporter MFP subunit